MIAIMAFSAIYGAADQMTRAFISQSHEARLVYAKPDTWHHREVDDIGTQLEDFQDWDRVDRVFMPGVIRMSAHLEKKCGEEFIGGLPNLAVWITGSGYGQGAAEWNERFDEWGVRTRFSQLCFTRFNPGVNVNLWYALEYGFPYIKHRRFTVCHAPGIVENHRSIKGTVRINEAIANLKGKGLDFDYEEMCGVDHDECIQRKARCHIFIDQLSEHGGAGKNSAEAIAFDCVVLSGPQRWVFEGKDDPYRNHPILNIEDGRELEALLERLITDRRFYRRQLEKTRSWKPAISYKNVVEYILRKW